MYRELDDPRDPIHAHAADETEPAGDCQCACAEPTPDAESQAAPGVRSVNQVSLQVDIG